MRWPILLASLATGTLALFPGAVPDDGDVRHLYPLLHLAIGLDTHAHALPYLLGWLENVEYPKNRMNLEFYVMSNEDTTQQQLQWWLDSTRSIYKDAKIFHEFDNWQEKALHNARLRKSAKIVLMTGDTVPTTDSFIRDLFIEPSHLVVCPLFTGIDGSTNFEASDELRNREIVREEVTIIALPLAINLTAMDSSYLTFDGQNLPFYEGANEPLEVLLQSAQRMDISIWADNQHNYGFFVNPELDVEDRRNSFRYQLADVIADGLPLPIVSRSVRPWVPDPELWDVDKIYVINLKRRPERRKRMEKIFELLGVEASFWEATDGQTLSELEEPYKSHKILTGYRDPIQNRPIKAGEIGCFLSHYRIWEEVVAKKYKRVIVFEDDLRFEYGGMQRVVDVLQDLDASRKPWDLIYLGRKKQADQEELWVPEHRHLSTVGYSYWTLGYLLSNEGAQKLLANDPLQKIVPVDEYLPIMFDKHPNKEWSSEFSPRDLRAFTLYPLTVFPQRYTNEPGYVSDTEDSILQEDKTSNEGYHQKQKKKHDDEL